MRKLWHRLFGHDDVTRLYSDGKPFTLDCSCGKAVPIKLRGVSQFRAAGLVSVNGILYTSTLDTSKKIVLRQSSDGGTTWTESTTPTYRWDAQDNG